MNSHIAHELCLITSCARCCIVYHTHLNGAPCAGRRDQPGLGTRDDYQCRQWPRHDDRFCHHGHFGRGNGVLDGTLPLPRGHANH
jgi:hypothetical protein